MAALVLTAVLALAACTGGAVSTSSSGQGITSAARYVIMLSQAQIAKIKG